MARMTHSGIVFKLLVIVVMTLLMWFSICAAQATETRVGLKSVVQAG